MISDTGIYKGSMVAERNTLITDGEGPLVFKDLARDIAIKRIDPILFDALSLWVAHRTEAEGMIRPTFQPGDTLSLLVPHLLVHNITDEDLREEARNTQIANGAQVYLSRLREEGWNIRVISTAYNHLWDVVGPTLGIPAEHIANSKLNLDWTRQHFLNKRLARAVIELENFVKSKEQPLLMVFEEVKRGIQPYHVFQSKDMEEVSQRFAAFYLEELPQIGFEPLKNSPVVNGHRKVEELFKFADELGLGGYDEVAYIGDSITDDRVLNFVRELGRGLAIAVNSDYFGIRNARIAVATADMQHLKPLLDAFFRGGVQEAETFVTMTCSPNGKERLSTAESESSFFLIEQGQDLTEVLKVHKEFRQRILGSSTPLI